MQLLDIERREEGCDGVTGSDAADSIPIFLRYISNMICIFVKFVSFARASDAPELTGMIRLINSQAPSKRVWSQ